MQELLDDFDLYGYAVLPAVVPVADVAAITRALLLLLERQPGYPEQHAVGRQGLLNDDPAVDALLTNFAYFASTPRRYFGLGCFHFFLRSASSFLVTASEISRFSASITILSPFLMRAIGPPSKASGVTCPITKP